MKIFLISIGLLLLFLSCQDEVKPIMSDDNAQEVMPTQESWNSKILITDDGVLKAVVYSDHIMMYEDKQETFLEGVKIIFYDDEGNKASKLTSKRGRVDDATQNMIAIDSVVAVNDSGTVLESDELKWENKTQKISTDKFVTITTDEERIEGYGFVSDQGLESYTIYDITYSARVKNK